LNPFQVLFVFLTKKQAKRRFSSINSIKREAVFGGGVVVTNKNFLIIVNSLESDELNLIGKILHEHKSLSLTLYLLYCTHYIPSRYFHLPSMAFESESAHKQATKMLSDIGQCLNINHKHLIHHEGSIIKQAKYLAKQLKVRHIIAGNAVMQEMAKKPGKGYINKEVRMDSINKMDHYCQSCYEHASERGT
jgi:hypothetical protein